MNVHEREEQEFAHGPRLWDADPSVCCAAFQLGACQHTEDPDMARDWDDFDRDAAAAEWWWSEYGHNFEDCDTLAEYQAKYGPDSTQDEPF